MTEVAFGDKVDEVRKKVGLDGLDLLNAWRTVNVKVCRLSGRPSSYILFLLQKKAREISYDMNGNVPAKQANTYSAINGLKKYFAEPRDGGDEMARLKIVDALQVKGAAAWIVHNAVKRNYDKHRKGIGSSTLIAVLEY